MGFSYFRNVLHKIPRPIFPPPPQRAHQHCPRHCHAGSRKGERGCVYIALYHEEETPPLFPLPLLSIGRRSPHHQPPPAPDYQPQPRRWIKPQPEQSTGIDPTGRKTAQKRRSSSRSPAAATKIFNCPLNLTGKANRPRRIAPSSATIIGQPSPAAAQTRNSSEYLANAPFYFGSLVFPRSLAFFIRRVSLFRYSPSRSKYIYLYPENIYISLLGGVC